MAFAGGRTSFAAPARRGRAARAVFFYVFDVLWLDGDDVRALPLRERKALLRDALDLRRTRCGCTPHRNERRRGDASREACRKGWEGLIAKRADSPYTAARSRDWLKFKCEQGQELVIGGFTPPKGSREEFGALLSAYYDGGRPALRGQGRHRLRPRRRCRPRRAAARRCAATRRRSPTPPRSASAT